MKIGVIGAGKIGMSFGYTGSLRKRYRELFCREIADTVSAPADVESELRDLGAVLKGNSCPG